MYTADVAIIGGGIVGSSIAYHLVAADCKNVLVIERETAQGKGSTGKSMGGVRAQFSTPGFVDPYSAMIGFMTWASDHGAVLWKNATVTGISKSGGGFEVMTTRDRVSARTVVNCGGAWAAAIAEMVGIDLPVEPLRRM